MKITEETLGVELQGLRVRLCFLSYNFNIIIIIVLLQPKLIKSGTLPRQQYVTHHIALLLHSMTLHAKGLNALFFLCENLLGIFLLSTPLNSA